MLPNTELSAIHRKTFQLKAITPVTIHGADGQTPELRLQSINGMMRYWYRMLQENPSASLTSEEAIFGSVRKDLSRKSSVWLSSSTSEENLTAKSFRPRNFFETKVYPQGLGWEITVSALKQNDIQFEQGQATFILAILLGGLGVRSRHSMSSFEIENLAINSERDFIHILKENMAIISDIQLEVSSNSIQRKAVGQISGPFWNQTRIFFTNENNAQKIEKKLGDIRKKTNPKNNKQGVLGGNPSGSATRYPSPLFTSIYPVSGSGHLIIVSEVYPEKVHFHDNGKVGFQAYEQTRDLYFSELESIK